MTTPDSIAALHARIHDLGPDLPERMLQCANYMLAAGDRLAVTTTAEFAAAANVQPSAVIRFCKMLGFSGYSEVQRLYRAGFEPQRPAYSERLGALKEGGGSIHTELTHAAIQSLEGALDALDPAQLERAVGVLAKARVIHVMGMRRAFAVAAHMTYLFEKLGVPVVLHDRVAALDAGGAIVAGDALIAISFAPFSNETLDGAQAALDRAIPVVLFTDTRLTPLGAKAEAVLCVPEQEVRQFRGLSAALTLAMTLALSVGAARVD
ncbi:putative HTH-type transcriptional regulator YbbH [Aquimixticola soesokkakensis]|uniref:Putative HTH-type transcriptional regulator YbbH n=1 Tax=Aquimixticola soesokkakensis TaxID=1519096 RepID=A0A1Y5RVL4_9RHOB|nr:MurR/RpiR family transcriptional regulator [Aquimixticola soesokkakensis]SLN25475.1 putative HTH-type transcriptional regulator YbbH [Aquimixticola soesokkakensis]